MEQTECCLGGIRLSGVLRPKQVASVGAQTKTRAWAFRLSSSCISSVSHACCKWLPPPAVPYHTPLRARLSTPNNDPVVRNAQYITNKNPSRDASRFREIESVKSPRCFEQARRAAPRRLQPLAGCCVACRDTKSRFAGTRTLSSLSSIARKAEGLILERYIPSDLTTCRIGRGEEGRCS